MPSYFFLILSFFLSLTLSGLSSAHADWTCKIDQDCLKYFHTILLDKKDEGGIYQYCQITYDENKLCCSDFSQCREAWAEGGAIEDSTLSAGLSQISQESLSSCNLSQLSPLVYRAFKISIAL